MATSKSKPQSTEPVSKDNPRTLQRVSDGAKARTTDQTEYVSMTSAMGYRDVTDEGSKSSKSTGSNTGSDNVGTGSGQTGTGSTTTAK